MIFDKKRIAALLLETGKAHHAAFIEVDGHDPDWPLWYARYLKNKLSELLGKELTISELVHQLIDLDRLHRAEDPNSDWHRFYARYLVEGYQNQNKNASDLEQSRNDIPSLTTDQMIEVDRVMIEDFQINLTQMMENAGRGLAHLTRERFFDSDPRDKRILLLVGSGGNGGGALVAARRLAGYGAAVTVVTTRAAESFKGVPRHQLNILQMMKIPIYQDDILKSEPPLYDLIIDGIIGYSLRGAPRGSAANLIRWANSQPAPVLALDVPSGIDGTTGMAYDPSIRATATLTLALPKTGLMADSSALTVGELYLADIGIPPQLFSESEFELEVGPIFACSDIVRLR